MAIFLKFDKYQGCGNDFILVNQSDFDACGGHDVLTPTVLKRMCDRNYGVGSDGLLLYNVPDLPNSLKIQYYYPDGRKARCLCGNATRCSVLLAHHLGITTEDGEVDLFTSVGTLKSRWVESCGIAKVTMPDVTQMKQVGEKAYVLNTGTNHHVQFVNGELAAVNIKESVKCIQHSEAYQGHGGASINFAALTDKDDWLKSRTYEKGGERETLACGTGSVATALAYHLHKYNILGSTNKAAGNNWDKGHNLNTQSRSIWDKGHGLNIEARSKWDKGHVTVEPYGGVLEVNFCFSWEEKKFYKVYLSGECKFVFSGSYKLPKGQETVDTSFGEEREN